MSNQDKSSKTEVSKAARQRESAKESEAPSRRHKGKSWEAVRSARKSFFTKISNSC
jgi:hypothetical protein